MQQVKFIDILIDEAYEDDGMVEKGLLEVHDGWRARDGENFKRNNQDRGKKRGLRAA
jgi:hypothetical protein